ncbi:hypothetical protein ACFL7M_04485 [Thermodesulfobacteriota bacterium]
MDDKEAIKNPSCSNKGCQPIEVPTKDELAALNAMRLIKDRVRDLKKMLSKVSSSENSGDVSEIRDLEKEMTRLKTEWKEWEKKKEDAAKERMILLGHEEA